ncbi:MAG: hypothetical protein HW402_1355 [Dehalococcoidales bacterium]|nr:hypothetical protein [Dehalococcoidales bacterium]
MITSDIGAELCQFAREYADDQCCLELLQFFGRYPHTRFGELAVFRTLNSRRLFVGKALKCLTDKKLVRRDVENSVPIYSLTNDESLRNLVLDLARLDRSQWQLLLRQVYPASTE